MTIVDAVARPIGRASRLPLFAPLAIRDYRLTWFGESVSLIGDHFHIVALSWLVLGLTGSGLALGAVLVASAIPRGIFMLVGGVLSDRIPPRSLVLASNIIRAVLTATIAALIFGDRIQIWHLMLLGVAFGTVDAVFYPAINTLVARLVPSERLAAANGLLQGTTQLIGTIGPAFAGFAIAIVGVAAAFAFDALTFVVAAIALWLVHTGTTRPTDASASTEVVPVMTDADDTPTVHPSMWASLVEGFRSVLGDSLMRQLVLLSLVFNLAFTGPIVVGLPWLVLIHFQGDAPMLGVLFGVLGAGSLIGAVLGGSLARPARFGSIVLGLVVVMGVLFAGIGLAPSVAVAALLAGPMGVCNGYTNVVLIAWIQERTEPRLLGRTMSFVMLGSVVAAPLSLALAGLLVDTHATALFVAAGVLVVVTALIGIASGVPRRMI
jgi:MFS family permease